jgi:hypothetical protein
MHRSKAIQIAPAKPISNEMRNACPPKALALPLNLQDFGTSRRQLAH